MKKYFLAWAMGAVVMLSAFTLKVNSTWRTLDGYVVKMKSEKFDGTFTGLKSSIQFDEGNPTAATISATIDAGSINTGNGMRNKHAQQGLDSDKFPTVQFTSTSVSKTASGYVANGKLTIKDVTKDIQIPFTFSRNGNGGIFNGGFEVVPAEYNVTKGGTPEKLSIELQIPVSQ